MSLFRAHLWKEWRENRGGIVGVLGVVLLAAPLLVMVCQHFEFPLGDAPATASLAAIALVMIALGGEVLARELSSDRRAAISRLPAGLPQAFYARVWVYLASIVGAGALAYGWSAAWLWWLAGEGASTDSMPLYGSFLFAAAVLASWSLTPSCWLRQSMLATPAGVVLLLILIGLPFLRWKDELTDIFVQEGIVGVVVALSGLGLLAAWMSFSRGVRGGTCRRSATIAGMATLLLGCIPLYGYAAERLSDWRSFDVRDANVRFGAGWFGSSGRPVYLNALDYGKPRRESASGGGSPSYTNHALIVDVTTGEWRDLGPGSHFTLPWGSRECDGAEIYLYEEWPEQELSVIDMESGERLRPAPEPPRAPPRAEGEESEALQSSFLTDDDEVVLLAADHLALLTVHDVNEPPQQFSHRRAALRRVVLLNLVSGERDPVYFETGDRARVVYLTDDRTRGGRTPSGAPILHCFTGDIASSARFDVEERRLVPVRAWTDRLLRCLDEDSLLVLSGDGRKIVRARFGEAEMEVVFPRESR